MPAKPKLLWIFIIGSVIYSSTLNRFYLGCHERFLVRTYSPVTRSPTIAVVAQNLVQFWIETGFLDSPAKLSPIIMMRLSPLIGTAVYMVHCEEASFCFTATLAFTAHMIEHALQFFVTPSAGIIRYML